MPDRSRRSVSTYAGVPCCWSAASRRFELMSCTCAKGTVHSPTNAASAVLCLLLSTKTGPL